MAESEIIPVATTAGGVQGLARWGILRLLRRWPGDQVAAGGRAEPWPDDLSAPRRGRPELTLVSPAEPAFALRAKGIALRQVLAEWRAADRALETLVAGSRDWSLAQAEVALLRASHHRLFIEISRRAGPTRAEPERAGVPVE